MKNKNGFTLIEVLASIAIMLLIVTIATTSILSLTRKNSKEQYQSYLDQFIANAKLYVNDHKPLVNNIIDKETCYKITLKDLLNFNFIDEIPKNPITKKEFDPESGIAVKKNSEGIFSYLYIENKDYLSMCLTEEQIKEEENYNQENEDKYKDNSGANIPVLADGMFPVIYDEATGKWLKASDTEKWYDYDNQWWANAVTVTKSSRETYKNAEALTEIKMEDINTMWVWIPRFKYKIPSNVGSNVEIASPPEIDIVFETHTRNTGANINYDGVAQEAYYTHPAFRDGSKVYKETPYDQSGWDKELTGFWVGKFITGGTTSTPLIKPDITILSKQNIATQFQTALKFAGGTLAKNGGTVTFSGNDTYGLNNKVDTHSMKNIEWGAIAYLSQSKYGKMGNSNFTGANKEVYLNNSYKKYTGRSAGTFGDEGITCIENGSYTYDGNLISSGGTQKELLKGTGASSTGTIYGVYDMVGIEQTVMLNTNNSSGNKYNNSGFNGNTFWNGEVYEEYTEGYDFPNLKYYDLYEINYKSLTASVTKDNTILGDAIYETQKWYGDYPYYYFVKDYPFFRRGGSCNSGTTVSKQFGIFLTGNPTDGSNSFSSGFRAVLIP